jgi:hypothetical protein
MGKAPVMNKITDRYREKSSNIAGFKARIYNSRALLAFFTLDIQVRGRVTAARESLCRPGVGQNHF